MNAGGPATLEDSLASSLKIEPEIPSLSVDLRDKPLGLRRSLRTIWGSGLVRAQNGNWARLTFCRRTAGLPRLWAGDLDLPQVTCVRPGGPPLCRELATRTAVWVPLLGAPR